MSDATIFFAKLRPFQQIAFTDDHRLYAMLGYKDTDQLIEQQIAFLKFWREHQWHWARFRRDTNGYIYAEDSEDVVIVHPTWLESEIPVSKALSPYSIFHKFWTATVNTSSYEKSAWQSVESQMKEAGLFQE